MRTINIFILALCFLNACGNGSGYDPASPYGLYLAQVRTIMYDAWQQPSSLAGKQGLVARVSVRVQQDGKIIQKKMMDTSGNNLMDASVMTAVESVKEVPKLPTGFGGAYKDITIDFELSEKNNVGMATNSPNGRPIRAEGH